MFLFVFWFFYLKFISSLLSYFFENANYVNPRSVIKDSQIAKSNNSEIFKPKTNRDDDSRISEIFVTEVPTHVVSMWRDVTYIVARFWILHIFRCVRELFFSSHQHTLHHHLAKSKSVEEKTKSKRNLTPEWQDCSAIHWQRLPMWLPANFCTGAFGCVVTVLANLYAYIIICRHRYIHVTPTPFGRVVRIYETRTSGRFFNVFGLWMDASSCWFYSCQALFSSLWSILRTFGAIADPAERLKKKKIIRDFLDGWILRNYDILLGVLERFILRTKTQSKFYFQMFEHIFIYVIFQFALSEYCERLFCVVFLSDENSCTVFVQYKKC